MQWVLNCMKLLRDERLELCGMTRSELVSRMYCLGWLNTNTWVEHYYVWASSFGAKTNKQTKKLLINIWMRLIVPFPPTVSLLICQICGCHYRRLAASCFFPFPAFLPVDLLHPFSTLFCVSVWITRWHHPLWAGVAVPLAASRWQRWLVEETLCSRLKLDEVILLKALS